VPYRNAAQGVTDLIAGRVDAMFYHPLGLKPHLEAGTLKALAVTSAHRVSSLPDVPTMREAGVDDFVVEGLWNLFGPAAMPAEIVTRLNRATNALLADPAALANLRAQGVEPTGGTPEALAVVTRDEIAKWRPIIAAAGIKPD
jgi:tripartite-type tricarboxylate transporter receptor subunit TctC